MLDDLPVAVALDEVFDGAVRHCLLAEGSNDLVVGVSDGLEEAVNQGARHLVCDCPLRHVISKPLFEAFPVGA